MTAAATTWKVLTVSGKVLPLQLDDQLAYLTDISYCVSQSAITQTVLEVFKNLAHADTGPCTKDLVQETEIWD